MKTGLKNAVKAGTLNQLRGVGASGSFKVASTNKEPKKKVPDGKVAKKNETASRVIFGSAVSVSNKATKATKNKKVNTSSPATLTKVSPINGITKKAVLMTISGKNDKKSVVIVKKEVVRAKKSAVAKKNINNLNATKAAATKVEAKSRTKSYPRSINIKTEKPTVQAQIQEKKSGRSLRK